MSDELLRRLERAAASGDPEAQAKYIIVRRRHGKDPLFIILNSFSQLEIRMAEIMKDMVPVVDDVSAQMEMMSEAMTKVAENFPDLKLVPEEQHFDHIAYRERCRRSQAPFRRPERHTGRGRTGGRGRRYRPQVR
jgi:hypothetical protein